MKTNNQVGKVKEQAIHEGHRERMRTAVENDPDLMSFSDFQTLELVLSYLIPRKDTNPIAHALINEFGSLYNVFQAPRQSLYNIRGMTNTAASFISTFYSIMRKSESSRQKKKDRLAMVQDVVEMMAPNFIGREEERIYCITLDINDVIKRISFVSDGFIDTVNLNYNRILSIATQYAAKKIIVAHNHPSGNLDPSPEDDSITRTLFVLLANSNIILSDHIIFNNDGNYYSFFEHGVLDDLAAEMMGGSEYMHEVRKKRTAGVYIFDKKDEASTDPEYKQRTYSEAQKRLMEMLEEKFSK